MDKQNRKRIPVRGIVIGEGMPKICVSIMGATKEEVYENTIQCMNEKPDMVELRYDFFDAIYDATALKELLSGVRQRIGNTPLIFTLRTKNEGGEKSVSYEQYERILLEAAAAKTVDIIDVEVFLEASTRELIEKIHEENVLVIGSSHDFMHTPELETILKKLWKLENYGSDICKIAVTPNSKKDVLVLLSATQRAKHERQYPIVTMAMGKLGVISRISGEIFGSTITFGACGKASAPGQIEINTLRNMMELLHISTEEKEENM